MFDWHDDIIRVNTRYKARVYSYDVITTPLRLTSACINDCIIVAVSATSDTAVYIGHGSVL